MGMSHAGVYFNIQSSVDKDSPIASTGYLSPITFHQLPDTYYQLPTLPKDNVPVKNESWRKSRRKILPNYGQVGGATAPVDQSYNLTKNQLRDLEIVPGLAPTQIVRGQSHQIDIHHFQWTKLANIVAHTFATCAVYADYWAQQSGSHEGGN